MKLFRFTKLSTKLLALFVFILGVTLIGLFAVVETREYFIERQNLIVSLQRLIKTQSVPVTAALWEFDDKKINSFLSEVASLGFVQGAFVLDSAGEIVATKGDINTSPRSPDFVVQKKLVFQSGLNSETLGSLRIIAHDRAIIQNIARRIQNTAAIFVLLLVVLTGATFFATSIVVGRPLRLLLAAIERIRRDGVRERVDWESADELGQVVAAYNEMQSVQEATEDELRHARDNLELRVIERTKELADARDRAETALTDLKKTQERLVQSQKMASLGELTAGIAHEIRNPLNFVNNFAQTSIDLINELKGEVDAVRDKLSNDARENTDELFELLIGDLEKVHAHGRRADEIVKSMLMHARSDGADKVETALNPLVREALHLAYHGERAKDKSFQIVLDEQLQETAGAAEIIPQEFTRVLVNLLGNAFYAVKKRGQEDPGAGYEPSVSVTTAGFGNTVEIRVRDNGTGISDDVRKKLFEPFFTTKPPGEGTGLGLSICYDTIVHRHGGQMSVDSNVGEFTEVIITLPRHAGNQESPEDETRAP